MPAWIDTSSAETGSSSTKQVGLQRERPRDADALSLPTGELVREAVRVLGIQSDQRHQILDPLELVARGRRRGCASARSMIAAHRHARVERRVRILEDDLDLAAQPAEVTLALLVGELLAAEVHRPRRRARSAAAPAGPSCSCRSPTHRPARASCPARSRTRPPTRPSRCRFPGGTSPLRNGNSFTRSFTSSTVPGAPAGAMPRGRRARVGLRRLVSRVSRARRRSGTPTRDRRRPCASPGAR